MIPFSVNRGWYEDYWYGPEEAAKPSRSLPRVAGRIAAVIALLAAGLRGFGHL